MNAMKIYSCTNYIAFGRQLKPEEEAEYSTVLRQAKDKIGNKGHSMLIVPASSLPDSLNSASGCGNILSKDSQEFFDFAKLYWGINYVQTLPNGDFSQIGSDILPYSGSALDLGLQVIDLKSLSDDEYGKLLKEEDLKAVYEANNSEKKDVRVNYENSIHKDSPKYKTLKKAYEEFLKQDTPKKKQMLEEFEAYKIKNSDWLERKTIYKVLEAKNGFKEAHYWENEAERHLFDSNVVTIEQRNQIINELKTNPLYKTEGEFYEFTQFLADSHLKEARGKLNKKGIKLSGDMIINGGTYDEVWAFPKAFRKDGKLPWSLNAINFDTPEGIEYLKLKVRNFANRYDGVRIDASWLYVRQKVNDKYSEYGGKILDIIDEEFKNVKGKDFDLRNITYEFENGGDYSVEENFFLKKETRDRVKIYKSDNLSEVWGSTAAFKNRGWQEDKYMLGATNHDTVSLKTLYESSADKKFEVLSKILKIPKEKLNSLSGFIQAKFAEPMRAFHNMFFFVDALNLDGNYKEGISGTEQYRLKIPSDYKDKYFKSLEKGEGFNIMDALEKAFVAEGLNESESELYNKIIKFRDILNGNEKPEPKRSKGSKAGWIVIASAAAVLGIAAIVSSVVKKKHNEEQKA